MAGVPLSCWIDVRTLSRPCRRAATSSGTTGSSGKAPGSPLASSEARETLRCCRGVPMLWSESLGEKHGIPPRGHYDLFLVPRAAPQAPGDSMTDPPRPR